MEAAVPRRQPAGQRRRPSVIGTLGTSRGFGAAFAGVGVAFLLAAIARVWVSDTLSDELS